MEQEKVESTGLTCDTGSSPRTSCKVGSFPEALGADRRPRSDAANAFAAAHAKSAPHLLRHAASTLPFSNTGAPWALCCAKEVRKLAVSADHRPPNLSCEDNEPGPPSFPCQFRVRTLPPSRGFECCTLSGRRTCPAVPSPRNALTNVTSIASWAPSEQATLLQRLSNRLPSTPRTCDKSTSRTITLVENPCSFSADYVPTVTSTSNPLRPRAPETAQRRPMMAKAVEETATSADARVKGQM